MKKKPGIWVIEDRAPVGGSTATGTIYFSDGQYCSWEITGTKLELIGNAAPSPMNRAEFLPAVKAWHLELLRRFARRN
jgi:hypothetical protein